MHRQQRPLRENGVALVTVMVILLLSIIAVLAAARTGLLNEALVGNDSDYGRALAAAEALLRDAETDIRGRTDQGFLCRPALAVGPDSNTSEPGFVRCRDTAPPNVWFPDPGADFDIVQAMVNLTPATPCLQGICIPNTLATLAGFEDAPAAAAARMATMAPLGVRYGTFTRGAAPPPMGAAVNQILSNIPVPADPEARLQGWYWVEMFRFSVGGSAYSAGLNPLTPDKKSEFIYRITAIALGQKTGTRAVVRSFFVPNPIGQNK